MNLRKILLAAAGLGMMILNTSAQTSKRYTVAKPGTLVEMLTEDEANEITRLISAICGMSSRNCKYWIYPMRLSACMPERTVRIPTASISIRPIAFRPTPFVSSLATELLSERHL